MEQTPEIVRETLTDFCSRCEAAHLAGLPLCEVIDKQLKIPESVVIARDIIYTGNTSAASVPLAMHALLESGEVKSGGLALQIGFGAGLAFGAQVVVLP